MLFGWIENVLFIIFKWSVLPSLSCRDGFFRVDLYLNINHSVKNLIKFEIINFGLLLQKEE